MCSAFEQYRPRMEGVVKELEHWPNETLDLTNIRPSNKVGTIDAKGYKTRRWLLVPRWSKSDKLKYTTFNAKAEMLDIKSSYSVWHLRAYGSVVIWAGKPLSPAR